MTEKSKKQSKLIAVIAASITLAVLAVFGFVVYKVVTSGNGGDVGGTSEQQVYPKFKLSEKYYNNDAVSVEISEEEFDKKVSEKESFVVLVSLPKCTEETAAFKEYVKEYQRNNKISFSYMTSDVVKNTTIYEKVKYFPSVILYENGEMRGFLRFDSNADVEYYKSEEKFKEWFEERIEV